MYDYEGRFLIGTDNEGIFLRGQKAGIDHA